MKYLIKIKAKIENENIYMDIHRKEFLLDTGKTFNLAMNIHKLGGKQLKDILESFVQIRANDKFKIMPDGLHRNEGRINFMRFVDFIIDTATVYPYGYIEIIWMGESV